MNESENIDSYMSYYYKIKGDNLVSNNRELSYWGNFPIEPHKLTDLYKVYKSGYKFLDLGSGAGQVLNFAKNIGYDVTGVEFDKQLVNASTNTIEKDIRKLSKDFYKDFDVIYSYQPIKNNNDFQNYLSVVIDNMKIGSFLITPDFTVNNKLVIKLDNYLYQKK